MKKQKWCQKCGEPRGESVRESDLLCRKCIKSLPHCEACTIICGAEEWDYHMEKEAIPYILNGKKIFLCGGCSEIYSKAMRGRENKYFILEKNRKIIKIPVNEIREEIEIINTGPN